jgi:glycosyltransferase involved in cell wall biosynthesis
MMESWLVSTPVLVHADCPVTRGHVVRSRGGLYFRDVAEFQETVRWLLDHQSLAERMGQNGRHYVTANYTWASVVHRLQDALERWWGLGG